MNLLRLYIPVLLLLGFAMPLAAETKIDPMELKAEDFLRIAHRAPGQETWAKMIGYASHKRENARRIKAPIRLGIRFTPARIVAQLVFNKTEKYNLGQSFEPPVSTQESSLPDGTNPQLPLYGIDITDLTLGFLYRDLIREDAPDRIKTMPCRVFLLKGMKDGETARVYISTDYFFPLKVQWFRADPQTDPKAVPWRTMEIASVQKAPDNDFYLIPKIELSGPGWVTMIHFEDRTAGYAKDGMPGDLFLTE